MVEPIQASVGDEGKVTRDLRAEGGMTLGIVKRTEEEFADWLGTEWGFAEGWAAQRARNLAPIPTARKDIGNRRSWPC